MKSRTLLCTSILVLFLAAVSTSQERNDAIPTLIAWPPLHLGMEKQEALRKMSSCCKITEIGIQNSTDTAGIVLPKEPSVGDISGVVYFRGNKVAGIARDVSGNATPEVYETGIALYRLLTRISGGKPSAAVIRTSSVETTNSTTRYVKLDFAGGGRVSIQVNSPDPGSRQVQSVLLSECEGTCADW